MECILLQFVKIVSFNRWLLRGTEKNKKEKEIGFKFSFIKLNQWNYAYWVYLKHN